MMRSLGVLLVALVSTIAFAQEPAPAPRLLVVIAIDQFRADYLQRFRSHFGATGFNLFLRRGASFTEAEYQHAVTLTCPGHAVILTGTHANINGIISNQWYDTTARRQQYCVADQSAALIGSDTEGRSPRNLIGSTVGDELKRSNAGRSRVITVAGKDRSAIMLGGHDADAAYWINDSLFLSSTYYMEELPAWVKQFNASGRVTRYQRRQWGRVLPDAAYEIVGPDDVEAEENVAGLGRRFPHPLMADSFSRFIERFKTSPYHNEVVVEFAMAAISAERLGQDQDTDLLGVSLSANDLIGHAFGPQSHEVMDAVVRTDRLLQRFFRFLDQRVGLQNVLIVLTSDHGVAPLPERARQENPEAARLDPATIATATETALRTRFGAPARGNWVVQLSTPWIYLNLGEIRRRGIDVLEAETVARDAAKAVAGVNQAFTATELREQQERGTASSATFSFYPERSGNIYFEVKPFVIAWADSSGTTHGSPWSYDTRVPLLWFGASVKRGVYPSPVGIADIAPTISAYLGIRPPAGAQGRVLREVLP
jgi:predicted AlkP superfamily pyrophosphatase or phosphodiesterase